MLSLGLYFIPLQVLMSLLLSVLIIIVQASVFSLLPSKLSTSSLSMYQFWISGVLLPLPGLFMQNPTILPHCLYSVLGLVAVCCLIQHFCVFPYSDVVAVLCILFEAPAKVKSWLKWELLGTSVGHITAWKALDM